jgi:hypothetical protein
MDKSTWIVVVVVVAGLAAALGYGITQGFVDWRAAAFLILVTLAVVASAGEMNEPVFRLEPVPEVDRPPVGFHPTD